MVVPNAPFSRMREMRHGPSLRRCSSNAESAELTSSAQQSLHSPAVLQDALAGAMQTLQRRPPSAVPGAPTLFARLGQIAAQRPDGNDIAAVLHSTYAANSLDNFGVTPPAGTYALDTLPLVGLVQSTYSIIMSCFVLQRGQRANAMLHQLQRQCMARELCLEQVVRRAADHGTQPHITRQLRQELAALRAFRASVVQAQRLAMQDMALPGGARFLGASSILGLAIDRVPTVLGTTTLLPTVAGAVLGGLGGGLLSIFGLVWLTRNARQAYSAWTTPVYSAAAMAAAPAAMQKFLRAANHLQRQRRIYYSVLTLASVTYSGSATILALGSNGVGLIPASLIPCLAAASATSLAAELRWGGTCGPHNTNTPHNDRTELQSLEARSATWNLLMTQRHMQASTRAQVLGVLPPHHRRALPLSPRRPWLALSKATRYRLLRRIGLARRLGAWCARDAAAVDAPMRVLMADCNWLEAQALRRKLEGMHQRLQRCCGELTATSDLLVRQRVSAQTHFFAEEVHRLQAIEALQHELTTFSTHAVRADGAALLQWNRLRLGFVAAHGLVSHFFSYAMVRQHPDWFQCNMRTSRFLKRRVVTDVRLADAGLERAAAGFDATLERQFANLLLGHQLNSYERNAVLGLDADARATDWTWVQQQLEEASAAKSGCKRA